MIFARWQKRKIKREIKNVSLIHVTKKWKKERRPEFLFSLTLRIPYKKHADTIRATTGWVIHCKWIKYVIWNRIEMGNFSKFLCFYRFKKMCWKINKLIEKWKMRYLLADVRDVSGGVPVLLKCSCNACNPMMYSKIPEMPIIIPKKPQTMPPVRRSMQKQHRSVFRNSMTNYCIYLFDQLKITNIVKWQNWPLKYYNFWFNISMQNRNLICVKSHDLIYMKFIN